MALAHRLSSATTKTAVTIYNDAYTPAFCRPWGKTHVPMTWRWEVKSLSRDRRVPSISSPRAVASRVPEIAKTSLFATFLIFQILQTVSRRFMRLKMPSSRSFHAPAFDIRDAMRPTSAKATVCA